MKGTLHIVLSLLWVFASCSVFAQEAKVENVGVEKSDPAEPDLDSTASKNPGEPAGKEDLKLERRSLSSEAQPPNSSEGESVDTKVCSSAQTPESESPQARTGFSLQAGAGFVSCMPNGAADCAGRGDGSWAKRGFERHRRIRLFDA